MSYLFGYKAEPPLRGPALFNQFHSLSDFSTSKVKALDRNPRLEYLALLLRLIQGDLYSALPSLLNNWTECTAKLLP